MLTENRRLPRTTKDRRMMRDLVSMQFPLQEVLYLSDEDLSDMYWRIIREGALAIRASYASVYGEE